MSPTGPPSFELAELTQAIRWWMWIGLAALLVIARFLPRSLPRRTVGLVVCTSLAVAAIGLNVIVTKIRGNRNIDRTATLDPLIAGMAKIYQPERPTLLVLGSSRSTLGLDGAMLEQKLDARLHRNLQVLQFTATGHYALEQLYTTRKLVERMRPKHLTILVELGTEIDLGVPDALLDTTRGIDFFNGRVFRVNWRLWRTARAGNADDPAYTWRQQLRALSHTLQHHLGIGLLFDLQLAQSTSKGFSPYTEPPPDSNRQDVRDALAESSASRAVPSDRRELVTIVRDELVDDLKRIVPSIDLVFFFPPTADPDMRAHAPVYCAAVAHLGPCVYMSDDEVRTLLPPASWLDPVHLTAAGAPVFTDWLAAHLAPTLAGR